MYLAIVLMSLVCHGGFMNVVEFAVVNEALVCWVSERSDDIVRADLIPQLIISLNPQSFPFTEAVNIHTNLLSSVARSLLLTTPDGLAKLGIVDADEQLTVHGTVLKQVIIPSEKYICHLCFNRFSIFDGVLCMYFLALLAAVLEISPYYQPTMELVLNTPVFLSIPSCLTFFENDRSIWVFLSRRRRGWSISIKDALHSVSDLNTAEKRKQLNTIGRCSSHPLPPTTRQLLTGCPLTLRQSQPNRTRGMDEIAVGSPQRKQHKRTQHRADRPTDRTLAQLITWLTTSSPQLSLTHHIIVFAHSMCRCCLVTARIVGDTRIPVESTAEAEAAAGADDVKTVESEGDWKS
ncbi:hypothetical protein BLNAU_1572 [Blattamonas nauphoetae]|uniref:Uncharacterized protein n=1 Tax=Blattamonas nauphoetae TaxID=2049346 RepID=A0ABQ9YIU8_9EUKA|nr:hypothetical protein BLNAU_1572 [Blattamonas nauphoetae]